MARHYEEASSDYDDGFMSATYSDKREKAHRARNIRRELDRRMEQKRLRKMIDNYDDYGDYDLD